MAIDITMPRLSDTMEEGTLVKWHVNVGDRVAAGDLLADVETDKATMEVQTYDDGVVTRLAAEVGQTLPVGELIATLEDDADTTESAAPSGAPAVEAPTITGNEPTQTPTAPPAPAARGDGSRLRVSPVARRLAAELGVDLERVEGSGPDGRIVKRDVLAAAPGAPVSAPAPDAAPPAAAPPVPATPAPPAGSTLARRSIQLSAMRKTIARRLVESTSTIPHFTVTVEIDVEDLMEIRRGLNGELRASGDKLSVNDFVVRAAGLALAEHGRINAQWAGDTIEQFDVVHVGVAVALPEEKGGGLVVPTLRDVPDKSLLQLSRETRATVEKARTVGLTVEEMSDATFTVSNLGMYQVEHFEAIINPPQAAILAVGGAIAKPVVHQDRIVARRRMTCTVSCDHRVVDGASAAEFLGTLQRRLENPATLLL